MVNDYLAGLAALGLAAVSGEAGGLENTLDETSEVASAGLEERYVHPSIAGSGADSDLSGARYLFDPNDGDVENPLFQRGVEYWEGDRTLRDGTPESQWAVSLWYGMRADERMEQEFIEYINSTRLPDSVKDDLIPDSTFNGNPISFGY